MSASFISIKNKTIVTLLVGFIANVSASMLVILISRIISRTFFYYLITTDENHTFNTTVIVLSLLVIALLWLFSKYQADNKENHRSQRASFSLKYALFLVFWLPVNTVPPIIGYISILYHMNIPVTGIEVVIFCSIIIALFFAGIVSEKLLK